MVTVGRRRSRNSRVCIRRADREILCSVVKKQRPFASPTPYSISSNSIPPLHQIVQHGIPHRQRPILPSPSIHLPTSRRCRCHSRSDTVSCPHSVQTGHAFLSSKSSGLSVGPLRPFNELKLGLCNTLHRGRWPRCTLGRRR